jgi:putative nucleotidyltransferase with HDIG domain
LNTLLKDIVEHAATLLNASVGAMYLYNQADDTLEIVVSTSPAISIGTTLHLGEGMAGRVAQAHKPMRIEDYSTWEGRSRVYDDVFFHAVLEVPMLFGGALIGVLDVAEMNDSSRTYTESDERLLSLFAAQAAGVLHSARLREETARRAREFASLYETSKALSADNDLNTLLKDIVEHATTMLNAKTGAMYLYDRVNENLEVAVSTTPAISIGTTLHLGEGMAGQVAQTRQPMRIEDYSTWEGRLDIYDNFVFRADLEVPMLFGGDLIGVLDVAETGDSSRIFTESDERLLSLFAAQAAGVLHSARLREETARRAREFASLYETSNALSSENELNAMLQVIVEHARNLLGSASSGIYLYLPETGELELTVDTTLYDLYGTRLKLNEGLAGRVAQTRQAIRVDNYSTWEGRSPLYDDTPIRAVLEVPMLYGGELIGVLTADEVADSERKFTEADERLLSLFASQAAGAIHSARLREQTARRLDQLQALHIIDRAISSSFDLRPILNTVISHTISHLGVDAVDVLLYHPHLQTLEYVTGQGFHTSAIEHTHPRLGEGHAGRAALERHTIHIPNLPETGSNFKRAAQLAGEGFWEYYGVPLIAKGEVKGVLEVFNRTLLPRSPEWLDFLETLAGQAAITIDQTQLFENLQHANFELITAYDATIEGWARAMDLRDKETEIHTRRVSELTMTLAVKLGIKNSDLLHIRRGALLHDIGKMGVPDNILLKEGKLTEKEWELMRQHPQFAYEMLQPINYLRESLDIPYCHHEKWDGTGYPRGLKEEQIPLAARIFAIVDVWDAITSERPYRKGWTKQKALKYLREQSGKHFEPRIVNAFLEIFENEKR